MSEYLLRAELDGEVREETIYGDDRNMDAKVVPVMVHADAEQWEVADADASLTAIPRIMNLACEDPVWANGHIQLINVKTGRVVREMAAKGS